MVVLSAGQRFYTVFTVKQREVVTADGYKESTFTFKHHEEGKLPGRGCTSLRKAIFCRRISQTYQDLVYFDTLLYYKDQTRFRYFTDIVNCVIN